MNSVIHREKSTIIVTRACREIKLRNEDDVMDFVGSAVERLAVVRLWEEIKRDAKRPPKRPSEARVTLDDKDRETLVIIGRGEKVSGWQGPRIGRLKRLGYVSESGKLTTKGKREVAT